MKKEVEFDPSHLSESSASKPNSASSSDILVHKTKSRFGLPPPHRNADSRTRAPAEHLTAAHSVSAHHADVTLIDPGLEWTVNKEQSFSRKPQHAFPRMGNQRPRAVRTIVGGKTVWTLGLRRSGKKKKTRPL